MWATRQGPDRVFQHTTGRGNLEKAYLPMDDPKYLRRVHDLS